MKRMQPCIVFDMGQWTIDRRSVVLLMGVLIVIALVLVLPQVDLLDTAFHLGTAPILIHSQGTAKPAFQALLALFVFLLFATGVADQRSENRLLIVGIHEVQIFQHCFRC
ncbi:MAG: hypothetical protein WA477_19625 [Candidatus Sulfotelmatobacter sp.]